MILTDPAFQGTSRTDSMLDVEVLVFGGKPMIVITAGSALYPSLKQKLLTVIIKDTGILYHRHFSSAKKYSSNAKHLLAQA